MSSQQKIPLIQLSEPYQKGQYHQKPTPQVMQLVSLACLPGLALQVIFFGIQSLNLVMVSLVSAIAAETLCLWLLQKPIRASLQDSSAALTGLLLGLCLPNTLPWWLVMVGSFSSISLGKHIYGGLGQNPFNPAMVGYLVLLLSFPGEMSLWPATLFDSMSQATPLDASIKTLEPQNTWIYGMIQLGFLAGGLGLIAKGIMQWRIPLAVYCGYGLAIVILPDMGWHHLWLGAATFGAFFIATDPVSSPNIPQSQWIYGVLIGFTALLIRSFPQYPDGFAFAVLLANGLVPWLDQWFQKKGFQKPGS